MADFLPHDDDRSGRPDRTARIEELLLAGLDYYFAGEHERAINVWTRVLFLDRGHARARAYIERARGALAERQRESEELIQRGMAAFDLGDVAGARQLLSTAIARGGPHDVAFALLERLNRLDATASQAATVRHETTGGGGARRRLGVRRSPAPGSWVLLLVFMVGLGLVALYVAVSFSGGAPRSWQVPDRSAAVSQPVPEQLPLPRSADLALSRATALKDAGRLKEALTVLERIGPADASYGDARRLRSDIQSLLLAGLPAPSAPARTQGR
jgi:tetratricopeptide (TPR) repeat protein